MAQSSAPIPSLRLVARSGVTAAVVLVMALGLVGPAHAQSTTDKAAAQVLFEEARVLAKQGEWEAACPKFAQSQKLDPAGGTLLNLANCYARVGKTASAWVLFMEAEAQARSTGRIRRADEAKRRAAELKPDLSKLQIDVAEPVGGLVVRRGDETISEAQWGSSVPIDPGEYTITASAPGKQGWSEQVTVNAEAHAAAITVPALADAAPAGTPAAGPVGSGAAGGGSVGAGDSPDDGGDGSTQWILGWVVGGVGVAGVAVGTVLRIVALDKDEQSKDHCLPDDVTQCTAEGVELRDDAIAMQTGSIVGWAVGGAALAAGIILLVTAPSADDADENQASWQLLPAAGPAGGGVLVRGTF